MSYGVELYNEQAYAMVANSDNVFVVDYFKVERGIFTKDYDVKPGETLYAVAVFSMTPSQTNPAIWSLNVRGNRLEWSGDVDPGVYPETYIMVYKKGNVSSVPVANTFGIEIANTNGNLFILSDYNPFSFHYKYTLDGRNGQQEVNTWIPASTQMLMFANNTWGSAYISNINLNHYIKNGYWHIGMDAVSAIVEVYTFASRVHKDVRGNVSYGFEFYDSSEQLIMGNNSKPLKLYSYSPPYFYHQWPLGFKTAALGSVHLIYPGGYNPYESDNGGYGTVMSEDTYITGYYKPICSGANEIRNGSTTFPSDFLYINPAEYD